VAEGRIVAICGLGFLQDGTVMAFCHLTDEARRRKFSLHKEMCKRLAWARTHYRRIIALADPEIPTAERWLERLGFKPADPPTEINGQKVFVWQTRSPPCSA
jgi:hypothetical protein